MQDDVGDEHGRQNGMASGARSGGSARHHCTDGQRMGAPARQDFFGLRPRRPKQPQ